MDILNIIIDQEQTIVIDGVEYESMGPLALLPDDPAWGPQPHGHWLGRHPNGVRAWEGVLHIGFKQGFFRFWDTNGTPTHSGSYLLDFRDQSRVYFLPTFDESIITVKERRFYRQGKLVHLTHELPGIGMVNSYVN